MPGAANTPQTTNGRSVLITLPAAMSAAKEAANTMNSTPDRDRWANPTPSLAAKLAAFLIRQPNVWRDGKTLAAIAGYAAWRTRVSDLRRPPFNMHVINRQRSIVVGTKAIAVTEYMYIAKELQTEASAAAGAEDANCSV